MTGREVDVHVSDRPDVAPRRARAYIRRRGGWEWRCTACSNDGVLWRSWPAHSHQAAVQAACEHLRRGLHFWIYGVGQLGPFGPVEVAGGPPPSPVSPSVVTQHLQRRAQLRWGS